jgi:hypothetical protein
MWKKLKTAIYVLAVAVWFLWELFFEKIWTINVEKWAEKRQLDQTLTNQSEQITEPVLPESLVKFVDFVSGDFGLGVLSLAVILLTIDLIKWVQKYIKTRPKKKVDIILLAEKCEDLSGLQEAIKPFLKRGHISYRNFFIYDLLDVCDQLESITNRKGFLYYMHGYGTSGHGWANRLATIASLLRNNRIDEIDSVITADHKPQLPDSTEEEKLQ